MVSNTNESTPSCVVCTGGGPGFVSTSPAIKSSKDIAAEQHRDTEQIKRFIIAQYFGGHDTANKQ